MINEIVDAMYDYIYTDLDSFQGDPRFNITGWNSSFDGKPIPWEAMVEWRCNILATIAELKPKSAFELGCGSGMILFGLLPSMDQYCGIDISTKSIEYIRKNLTEEEKARVHLYNLPANQLSTIDESGYELGIINSASQYMGPKGTYLDYLENLVDKIVEGGHLFLGDLKAAASQNKFYEVIESWDGIPDDLEKRIQHRKQVDYELYLGEEIFREAIETISRIKGYEIRYRRGRYLTEMNIFRFDCIFYLDEFHPKDWKPVEVYGKSIEEIRKMILYEELGPRFELRRLRSALMAQLEWEKLKIKDSKEFGMQADDIACLLEEKGYKVYVVPYENMASGYFNLRAEKHQESNQ